MLKPQDILIALRIQSLCDRDTEDSRPHCRSQRRIADDTGVSLSEVNAACNRLARAGLLDPQKRQTVRSCLLEFLTHGLKYVFPARMGEVTRGMPTGYAAEPLKDEFLGSGDELVPVWPDPAGPVRGLTFEPIYRSAPMAARKDKRLYEYLALTDAIRGGRAREREMANEILSKRLG
jgi:DNA-binding transcriptional MocR family regulator